MSLDSPTFNKIIKKWGKSLVIIFNKEDLKILELNEGDIITLKIDNISRQGDK